MIKKIKLFLMCITLTLCMDNHAAQTKTKISTNTVLITGAVVGIGSIIAVLSYQYFKSQNEKDKQRNEEKDALLEEIKKPIATKQRKDTKISGSRENSSADLKKKSYNFKSQNEKDKQRNEEEDALLEEIKKPNFESQNEKDKQRNEEEDALLEEIKKPNDQSLAKIVKSDALSDEEKKRLISEISWGEIDIKQAASNTLCELAIIDTSTGLSYPKDSLKKLKFFIEIAGGKIPQRMLFTQKQRESIKAFLIGCKRLKIPKPLVRNILNLAHGFFDIELDESIFNVRYNEKTAIQHWVVSNALTGISGTQEAKIEWYRLGLFLSAAPGSEDINKTLDGCLNALDPIKTMNKILNPEYTSR